MAIYYLNRIGFSASHVKFVIAHAKGKDALVDSESRSEKHKIWSFCVDWFNNKLSCH